MDNFLGIYEKAIPRQPLPAFFDCAARAGFDFVEMSLDENDERLARIDWDQAACDAYRHAAFDCGLRLFSACLSGHKRFPLGSSNPEAAKIALELLHKATQLCDRLGMHVLQIAGFYAYYENCTDDHAKRYRDNLLSSIRWAEQYGVMYAIEPVEFSITTVSMALTLVRAANSPWLKIYPDAANMAGLGIDPIPEIEAGLSDSVALHVREALPDYYGNVEFGKGILDFNGLFAMLRRHNYREPITLEMWNEQDPNYFDRIKRSRIFIEQKWTNAL